MRNESWYGHLLDRGDDPSVLERRYRSHGRHDELSRGNNTTLILSQAARPGHSGHSLYTEFLTDPSDEFRRLDQSTIRNEINRRKRIGLP